LTLAFTLVLHSIQHHIPADRRVPFAPTASDQDKAPGFGQAMVRRVNGSLQQRLHEFNPHRLVAECANRAP